MYILTTVLMIRTVAVVNLSVITKYTRINCRSQVDESQTVCPSGYYITGGHYGIWAGNISIIYISI